MTEYIRNSNGHVRLNGEWVSEPETDGCDQSCCAGKLQEFSEPDDVRLHALKLAVAWSQSPNVSLRNGEQSTINIARKFETYLREG